MGGKASCAAHGLLLDYSGRAIAAAVDVTRSRRELESLQTASFIPPLPPKEGCYPDADNMVSECNFLCMSSLRFCGGKRAPNRERQLVITRVSYPVRCADDACVYARARVGCVCV